MGTETFKTGDKIIEVRLMGEFVGFRFKNLSTRKEVKSKVFSSSEINYKPNIIKFVNDNADDQAEAIFLLLKTKRKLS